MPPFFKSEAGRTEILALYDKKLAELDIDYESQFVPTPFGETHVIRSGDPANPPLILLHGSNGCAPIALQTYPNLSSAYCVYAIDVLAQPNKSIGVRPSMKDDSYGQWVNAIIDHLGLDQVTLAGFSFGGLVILKTLIHNESRIKEAFLAAPVYIVNGNPFKALWNIFIPMRRYMSTKKQEYVDRVIDVLFTERDDFALPFLSRVFLEFEMDFSPLPVISRKEAAAIATPLTLFAAKDDILFPGEKMIKRARKLFPSLRKAILLENSKHVQNRVDNERIEAVLMG
ncbi:MAG: alpha/beta hydrolase [Bacteroidota bacterium]